MLSVILVLLVIPWAILYYESLPEDPPKKKSSRFGIQILTSLLWIAPFILLLLATIALLWFLFGYSVHRYKQVVGAMVAGDIDLNVNYCANTQLCSSQLSETKERANPLIYLISVCSLIGWIALTFFGGVGLVALPVDIADSIINQPAGIPFSE